MTALGTAKDTVDNVGGQWKICLCPMLGDEAHVYVRAGSWQRWAVIGFPESFNVVWSEEDPVANLPERWVITDEPAS